MPKISQYEHLKPEVLAEFTKGLQPKDIYGKFPQIPPKTIRNWFQAQLPLGSPLDCPRGEVQFGKGVSNAPPPPPARPRSHLSVVDGDADEGDDPEADLRWVKRQLRAILRNEKNSAIKVQALNTYLRTIQIEDSMGPSKVGLDLSQLSDQELEKLAAGEDLEDAIAPKGIG